MRPCTRRRLRSARPRVPGASYATTRALRRAFEQRAGPAPVGVWRRLCLPASWAPFSAAELAELIAWWRSAGTGDQPAS